MSDVGKRKPGRPGKAVGAGNATVRLSPQLREQLECEASGNGWSVSEEIRDRLTRTFIEDHERGGVWRDWLRLRVRKELADGFYNPTEHEVYGPALQRLQAELADAEKKSGGADYGMRLMLDEWKRDLGLE